MLMAVFFMSASVAELPVVVEPPELELPAVVEPGPELGCRATEPLLQEEEQKEELPALELPAVVRVALDAEDVGIGIF